MAKLGDICTKITDGSHNPPQGISHSEYLMLSSKNIYDNEITLDDPRYLSAENYAIENKRTQISTGDILLTIVGTVGRAAVVSDSIKNICLQRSVAVIKPKSNLIDSRFLMYQLQSMRTHLEQEARGVAQKGIYLKQVENLQVKVPSMDEQLRVVKKLDKVSELIALRKEQLAKLDQLVKSRFIELFGDPVDNPKNYLVKSLQELIDMGYITYHLDGNHGGDYPRSEEFVDSGVPYIGANSIVNGKIDFSMAKFLTAERAGKLRKGIAQNDDVLFAHNATVGPTVVLKTTEPKVILSTSLTAYRCNQSVLLPNYLKAYMQSDGFVRQYSGEMKQTTRNQVPITAQKKYLFLVPPFVEQEQFAAFVKQTDKSKLAIQQSLDKLELLKESLMQEYFG